MLYIVGVGLRNEEVPAALNEIVERCSYVFAETYTSAYPWGSLEIEFEPISREKVESDFLINLAAKHDVCLLVAGDPLSATTHISLILDCIRAGVEFKVVHASSIFVAIAETGLSLYKFGKIASIPKWEPNYKPRSFAEIIRQNQSINAHTLLLIDPKLTFSEAKEILKAAYPEVDEIVALSIGEKPRLAYGNIDDVEMEMPTCIIVPAKLEPYEEEALKTLASYYSHGKGKE